MKLPCPPYAHNFVLSDDTYRCTRCEAISPCTGNAERHYDFYGSFFDNQTLLWHPDRMNARDITRVEVSFGDCPTHQIIVQNDLLVWRKGASDGWMLDDDDAPEHREILISDEQQRKLKDLLASINYCAWHTRREMLSLMHFAGFCLTDTFRCFFPDGTCFVCLNPEEHADFRELTDLLSAYAGLTADAPPPVLLTHETPGIITPCCGQPVPDRSIFCPHCGQPIGDKSQLTHLLVDEDMDMTCWFCECHSSNPFHYKYCSACGKKAPF